jgi:hypothetical protein
MSQALLDLYHRHVGPVFDRQRRLADFLDENGEGGGWGYDVASTALAFGKAISFEAHLLGSFAEGNRTWLWAWANRHLNLPAANRALAEAVRRLASGPELQVFAADGPVGCDDLLPEELADEAAHAFGVIVTGALEHDAYYTLPYEGGRGVAVIRDRRLRRPEPHPLLRISSVFTQAISGYPIPDHRAAFTAYAESCGLQARAAGEEVRVLSAGAEVMTARFDEQNRLTRLECTVTPTRGDGR